MCVCPFTGFPACDRQTLWRFFILHYYKHHIGDFIRDTSCLTDTQSMAYLRLLWMYYESETPLVNNPKVLALRVGTDADTVSLLLEAFFRLDGDLWRHSRCDAEIEEYRALSERNKTNGKAGGRPKKTQSVSSGLPVVTDTEPCRNPNHKPLTINHNKEENTYVGNGIPDCPHSTLIQLYAECLPNLTQPRVWEGNRASNMKARWRFILTSKNHKGEPYATDEESAIAFFRKFFSYVAKCDFLVGKTSEWQCDLPWLMKAENFNKVIEGKYQNKEAA